MILELIVAATIGITFANTWMCVLLTFGAAAEGVDASRYFIVGRFVGVVAIGLLIASFRLALQQYINYIFLAFGILSIVFAVLILGRQYLEGRLKRAKGKVGEKGCSSCAHCEVVGDGEGKDPDREKGHDLFASSCNCGLFSPIGSSCDHGTEGCGSWTPRKKGKFGARYGLALGLFRGATPCAKIILLAPLLIVADPLMSVAMILVYATTSTIYPLIGLMSAKLMSNIKGKSLYIRAAGAIIILIIGVYSILRFLLWDPNQPCLQ